MAGATLDKPADHAAPAGGSAAPNYLNHTKGLKSWLFTLDHKRIGIMYLGGVSFGLLLGGLFALLLRTELLSPDDNFVMPNHWYNNMFTLHGAVMVFLFIIPGIPASLGNFILPMQLGAKDLALPRVNLLSLWLYWIGTLFFVGVLITMNL
ncbi:MAG: cbb3-type cytochrome c oxidase subunit I, partial [Planctomycetes bacterium]|nr:cbb3-type cytochrome c oxidase subunit I [Planctomycetota bacterium]